MIISRIQVSIADLYNGFSDKGEDGVYAYYGNLNVRPKFQREFVYPIHKQIAVINSILKQYPLSTIYWSKNSDGTYELMDGQQRILSICNFIEQRFSLPEVDSLGNPFPKFFERLSPEEKERILGYVLDIYVFDGSTEEKLEHFKVINIANMPLTEQELRNATFSGAFVTEAKKYFSKTGCAAHTIASNYLVGNPIRQEYLETALQWISDSKGISIEEYMSRHQHDTLATELTSYFETVIKWAKKTFTTYRREMRGLNFGKLYEKYKDAIIDPIELENEIASLMSNEDVQKKSGIFEYVLHPESERPMYENLLSIRIFTDKMKREAYERQGGLCAIDGTPLPIEEMEADHIIPFSKGGKTEASNCQMISRRQNRLKSNK